MQTLVKAINRPSVLTLKGLKAEGLDNTEFEKFLLS
jgi:hypothetical protein